MSANYFRLQGYADGTMYRQESTDDVLLDVALSNLVCVCARVALVLCMCSSCAMHGEFGCSVPFRLYFPRSTSSCTQSVYAQIAGCRHDANEHCRLANDSECRMVPLILDCRDAELSCVCMCIGRHVRVGVVWCAGASGRPASPALHAAQRHRFASQSGLLSQQLHGLQHQDDVAQRLRCD